MHSKPHDNVKNKKSEPDFEPDIKTISSILQIMKDNRSEGKISISVETHLNYTQLARHIVWMQSKGLVESVIDTSKIDVNLTEKGKVFASTILDD